jgi:AcrR family transcriptional regulator
MKMPSEPSQAEKTRTAILNALAEIIVEHGGLGFSVQQVADRAGVTHRTVYNHFPTREALNDALAVHVEQGIGPSSDAPPLPSTVAGLGPMIEQAYRLFDAHEVHLRAYVMLMVASRGPAAVARERTLALEDVIRHEALGGEPTGVRGLAAALRMFASATGWHLLTEHFGLSPEEARATAVWATRAMLDAAAADHPSMDCQHDEEGEGA